MFVRHISHEIRTPLNAARMGLLLVKDELASGRSRQDCLTTLSEVSKASDVVLEVVNDFLLFDKIESGTLVLDTSRLNMMMFVEETLEPMRLQVGKSASRPDLTASNS